MLCEYMDGFGKQQLRLFACHIDLSAQKRQNACCLLGQSLGLRHTSCTANGDSNLGA